MVKGDRIQQVVMRGLAAVLVVSFLLTVLSLAWPTPVSAQHCHCKYHYTISVCACWSHELTHYDTYDVECCNAGQGCWWNGNRCYTIPRDGGWCTCP